MRLHPPEEQLPLLWQPEGLPDAPLPQLPQAIIRIVVLYKRRVVAYVLDTEVVPVSSECLYEYGLVVSLSKSPDSTFTYAFTRRGE
jgi:hypothetical protein